jgi:radical SAM protein with 4Fe4S-binding SPASM domain
MKVPVRLPVLQGDAAREVARDVASEVTRGVQRGARVFRKGSRMLRVYIEHSFSKEWFQPVAVPRASFETTNVCNAKCVFCANTVMQRRKQMLDMALFKKAVDELVTMGVTEIDFNVTIGDPLLDKKLLERARYVRQHPQFKTLGFVTTLQWFHLFDFDEFVDAGFTWLSLSITLSGREKYKEFFGVDCYDKMLENLTSLLEKNQRRGNPIGLVFSIKPTNEPRGAILEHEDFKRIAALAPVDLEQCIESTGAYVDDWGGAVKLPPHLKRRPLIPRWYRPCRFLYSGLQIYSNGKVGACNCRDFEADSDLILGSIEKDSLEQLWNGPQLQAMRDNWRRRNEQPNLCRTCRHYVY